MPDSVPSVSRGRGAWTTTGKDNNSRYYRYRPGLPLDGSQPTKDVNYFAVHHGVRAIQNRLNALGYASGFSRKPLLVDGLFGPHTEDATWWFQETMGIGTTPDGIVGPATAESLWFAIIFDLAIGLPQSIRVGGHLFGLVAHESLSDPGAVGTSTPGDRGLIQISTIHHPDISPELAQDPNFALGWGLDRLMIARNVFDEKGSMLQSLCSIANHNNPAKARAWYTNGEPPDEQIAGYVESVLEKAAEY